AGVGLGVADGFTQAGAGAEGGIAGAVVFVVAGGDEEGFYRGVLEGADVDGEGLDAREAGAALVGGNGLAVLVLGEGVVGVVDGGTAGEQGVGLGGAAVVGEGAKE